MMYISYFLPVLAGGQLTDPRKLSCTFDQSLCTWKASSPTAGNPVFALVKPTTTKNMGPSVDYNTGTGSGKLCSHVPYYDASSSYCNEYFMVTISL